MFTDHGSLSPWFLFKKQIGIDFFLIMKNESFHGMKIIIKLQFLWHKLDNTHIIICFEENESCI